MRFACCAAVACASNVRSQRLLHLCACLLHSLKTSAIAMVLLQCRACGECKSRSDIDGCCLDSSGCFCVGAFHLYFMTFIVCCWSNVIDVQTWGCQNHVLPMCHNFTLMYVLPELLDPPSPGIAVPGHIMQQAACKTMQMFRSHGLN